MAIGFRIRPVTQRVAPELVARAAAIPVANIGDVMNRMQTFSGTFHPYGGLKRACGPAFTVKARSGDNLMLHRAVDLAGAAASAPWCWMARCATWRTSRAWISASGRAATPRPAPGRTARARSAPPSPAPARW